MILLRMDGHVGSAPTTPVWKTGVYLSTLMPGEMARRAEARRAKAGIPCGSRTRLCGFADHRLGCSANGTCVEFDGHRRVETRMRFGLITARLKHERKFLPPPAWLFRSMVRSIPKMARSCRS